MPESIWSSDRSGLFAHLGSSENGLSSTETHARLKKHGPNVIPDKDKKAWTELLIAQLANPLIIILIIASVIAGALGEIFDMMIIVIIVLVSALLGFFQEYKSEKVLSELKKYFSYHAVVLRDGEKKQIDSHELVPGDIVTVGLGDIVPADLRIIETEGIAVDESVLTGESREVEKNTLLAGQSASTPQDIKNGLFMGTTIVGGYAKAIVVSTGQNTFFGKTAAVFSSKVPESDFQIQIRKFGSMLIKIISVITLFVFLTNYGLGHGEKNVLFDSILFALAIAVGIAPEGLPAIITITLSNGSMAMAKKKVITKKLAAIEDLGNMDVLCTDKTGTLTEALRVDRYVDLDMKDSHNVLEYAVLCNAAIGRTKIRGNAVDVAIRMHGKAQRVDVSHFKKMQEIPFDFVRRRMAQIVQEGRKRYLIVKGAPESVFDACTQIKMASKQYSLKQKGKEVRNMIAQYNLQGYTCIGVAYKDVVSKKTYSKDDEFDLIFIGFILLNNPPKSTAKQALERLQKLGIRLKVLTGDDPLVTKKLCQDVGFLPTGGKILTGKELAALGEKEFAESVEQFDVFARVTPEQKLKIIESLRAKGHVVGFLGDGINDAPSLRTADVGISVDTAADVAKGASHIILLHKSLGVVCDGVEEGRKIFGNITKYILNTMSANQGNMITVALSSVFLPFIPLLPSQILLNNLVSDVPLMSVSSDNVDKMYTKKPQKWDMNFIVQFMIFFGLISTIFDLIFILIMYLFMDIDTATFRTAWFLESVLSEMIIVFSLRTHLPFFKSVPSWLLVASSIFGIALAGIAVYFAPIAGIFYLVPLSPMMLVFTAAVLVAYFAATELGKAVFFTYIVKNSNHNSHS